MNDNTVVRINHSQDEVRERISKILTDTFLSGELFYLPPSSILTIFFRFLPQTGIRFTNRALRTCSNKQIKILEDKISKKLLSVYVRFTQYPSPREIMTDVFAELAKHNIKVIVPRDNNN